LNGPEYINLK